MYDKTIFSHKLAEGSYQTGPASVK